MLSLKALSALERRAVSRIALRPWTPPAMIAASGSQFLQFETTGVDGDRRHYVIKRIAPHRDLVMRLTSDDMCRERLVWQLGLIDDLRHEVRSPIVASAVDGDGWALLMRDATKSLLVTTNRHAGSWSALDSDLALFTIRALAALHANFWESASLRNPAFALCSALQLYSSLTPTTAAQQQPAGADPLLKRILEGWALLEQLVPADVARATGDLLDDPRPLCDALARYPHTLVHGDLRIDNLALSRGECPRLILLDWQFVGSQQPWTCCGSSTVTPPRRFSPSPEMRPSRTIAPSSPDALENTSTIAGGNHNWNSLCSASSCVAHGG
jgi:hypothetical protein